MHRLRRTLSALIFLVLIALCSPGTGAAAQPTAAPASTPAVSPAGAKARAQLWQEDLRYLARTLPRVHKNLFFSLPREEFASRLSDLEQRAGSLSDLELYLELSRLLVAVRDPHTTLSARLDFRGVPVKFHWFADGLYPVLWNAESQAVAGGRLVGVGDRSIAEVIRMLSPLVPADNQAGLKERLPGLLNNYDLLVGAGVIPPDGVIRYVVEDDAGGRRTVELAAGSLGHLSADSFTRAFDPVTAAEVPLYQKRNDWFWFEYLPERQIVYIQYNRCTDRDIQKRLNPKDPNLDQYPVFREFTKEVLSAVRANPVRTIVLDLRNNGGGSSMMGTRFIKALAAEPKVKAGARIVGIVGRRTFSSALINALDLRKFAGARLYGEATSGKPNHYGEVKVLTLPNSQWKVTYSTKCFRFLKEEDPDSLYPDVTVELSYQDYVRGRDPVLEAVLRDQSAAVP